MSVGGAEARLIRDERLGAKPGLEKNAENAKELLERGT